MTDSAPPDNRCLAVLLTFDSESERLIRDAGHSAARHFGRMVAENPGRPHITLHTTRTAEPTLLSHVQTISRRTVPLDITLSHWGIFPSAGALFLGATPDPQLVDLHRQTCEATGPEDIQVFGGLYLPGAWVPHCTLAMGVAVEQAGAWLDVLSRRIPLPVSVRGVALDVVRLESGCVAPLATVRLGA